MKNAILSLSLLFSTFSFAHAHAEAVPQCFGDAGVSEQEPYILTLPNLNAFQAHLVIEDLISDDLLKATLIFSSKTTYIFALGVNTSATLDINERVAKKVDEILIKYKTKYSLECNGTVTGNPRAGGSN